MPECPRCQVPLQTVRHSEGIYYYCNACCGRAVTIPQIRRAGGDLLATGLFRQSNQSQTRSERHCPFCSQRMKLLAHHEPALELDSCRRCLVIWFDPLEYENLPFRAPTTPTELERRSAELIAMHSLEQAREGSIDAPPEEAWKWLPGLFGMPVEVDGPSISRRPIATWTIALACALCSLLAFSSLDAFINRWGLIPSDWWRHGGLTLVSSFLLHGGWLHLVGNLYFLLVFGDNVEDYLGKGRMLVLLVAATLAGDVLHILTDPRSATPVIGASGGISGLIVFYALQFPRAKLGLLWVYYAAFRWIRIPAWGALIAWILLQVVGAAAQLSGMSNVSAMAHLGGAGAGFIAWLFWHRMEARQLASLSEED